MEKKEYAKKVGSMMARGVAREQTGRVRDRVEETTDRFKIEAAERVESLADQLRQLGKQFERSDEAQSMVRRLEKTADYLRYRPSMEVAEDAWDFARRSKLLWIAGGMLAGAIIYRIAKSQMQDEE